MSTRSSVAALRPAPAMKPSGTAISGTATTHAWASNAPGSMLKPATDVSRDGSAASAMTTPTPRSTPMAETHSAKMRLPAGRTSRSPAASTPGT